MRFSADYSRDFFDFQEADPARRAACEGDFVAGLREFLEQLGAEADRARVVAAKLWQQMGVGGRHYHTPVHVLGMFGWAERLGVRLSDSETLAVWFHDAVWEPDARGEENEQASAAQVMDVAADLALPRGVAEEAAEHIRWTARHTAPTAPAEHGLVMDLDLAGFAAEASTFAAQSAAVRAEFADVDDAAFAAGTIKLFESLLERERIYRSRPGQALEQAARRQLAAEVERLRLGAGGGVG